MVENPLMRWPLEDPCFCKKTEMAFKYCCMSRVVRWVPEQAAERIYKQMKKDGYR